MTALDLAAAEQKRQARFRELFERFDVLLTPAAPVKPFPVAMNFPDRINGRALENYIDWIAPAYLITLVSLPAATAPAGLTRDQLPVGMQVVAPRRLATGGADGGSSALKPKTSPAPRGAARWPARVARARQARYGDELARLLSRGLRRNVVNSGLRITIRPKGERRYVSRSNRPPALPPRRFCR